MGVFAGKYLRDLHDSELKIIDIGSQDVNGSYKPLFQNHNLHYTGADIVKGENVDLVIKNMYNWRNIKSSSYDVAISGQTFEHIEYFWFTIMELARILKTGGLCCVVAPSSGEEHRYPVDCWRILPDGINVLFTKCVNMNLLYCKIEGPTDTVAVAIKPF
jgi:SAM-dependent methyltransferase